MAAVVVPEELASSDVMLRLMAAAAVLAAEYLVVAPVRYGQQAAVAAVP